MISAPRYQERKSIPHVLRAVRTLVVPSLRDRVLLAARSAATCAWIVLSIGLGSPEVHGGGNSPQVRRESPCASWRKIPLESLEVWVVRSAGGRTLSKYTVKAKFSYDVDGEIYTSTRVFLRGEINEITQLGADQSAEAIRRYRHAFVDPADPRRAILVCESPPEGVLNPRDSIVMVALLIGFGTVLIFALGRRPIRRG